MLLNSELQSARQALFLQEDVNRLEPSWGKVLLCISVFVMQYWASGFFGNSISNDLLLILLGITALAQWAVFDATTQGLS